MLGPVRFTGALCCNRCGDDLAELITITTAPMVRTASTVSVAVSVDLTWLNEHLALCPDRLAEFGVLRALSAGQPS